MLNIYMSSALSHESSGTSTGANDLTRCTSDVDGKSCSCERDTDLVLYSTSTEFQPRTRCPDPLLRCESDFRDKATLELLVAARPSHVRLNAKATAVLYCCCFFFHQDYIPVIFMHPQDSELIISYILYSPQ